MSLESMGLVRSNVARDITRSDIRAGQIDIALTPQIQPHRLAISPSSRIACARHDAGGLDELNAPIEPSSVWFAPQRWSTLQPHRRLPHLAARPNIVISRLTNIVASATTCSYINNKFAVAHQERWTFLTDSIENLTGNATF
jgi:hypothetical protein